MIKRYQEKQYAVVCDRCGIEGPIGTTQAKAILAADRKGWRVACVRLANKTHSRHICPSCYDEILRD